MDRLRMLGASRRHAHIPAARPFIFAHPPERVAASQLTAFTRALETRTGQRFGDYKALHDFSVREFRTFWRALLEDAHGLDWSGDPEPVCTADEIEAAQFFPNVRLNYADTLLGLSVADADAPALTACHADGRRVRYTRGELRGRVERLALALSALGLREGDRVAGVLRNDDNAVVVVLAVTALGATMSTAAPEMGVDTILDRFAPLSPTLLFAHTAPRAFDTGEPLAARVAELAGAMPSLRGVISIDGELLLDGIVQPVHALDTLLGEAGDDLARFEWRRFPFNQPLFIMFSSGTTGKPKCIVHGAGGVLLEHLKEHRLHGDLRPGERLYFHTSCAWMMWNWQLSALASGVEIVTYDGPVASVETLWKLVADEHVTAFGTSPAYLRMCEDAGLEPGRQFDLSALRSLFSTGAVIFDAQFSWIREHVKPLPVQSISGGTDILGCFVLGNPNLPVYAGEAQCLSLALDVRAWAPDPDGGRVGQLVCANPFPSRPLGFFGDTDGAAFHRAYFAANPGVWTHGDLIDITPEGSARMHGRFDGVLNVRGINVGPGEIYLVLNDIHEIREAIVVEQHARDKPGDRRVVLLIVLQEGAVLNGALAGRIRRDLARRASPAHVPDVIAAVGELPFTHSGKPSEAAARNAVNGLPVGNTSALRNPACLDAIRHHPALRAAADGIIADTAPSADALDTQTGLERYLQMKWETLFGFGPIGRDDSFFELGGHSLLAARLLADVKRATGRSIPLATMLVAPTLAQLAATIMESTLPPSSPIQIRAGQGAPLFVIHSVSGTVMEYWALAAAMGSTRPIHGLQARGLDGDAPAQHRVEDMAASYIEQIRAIQPGGPYAIAGYSFGGLVALEIAQQLLRAGERVSFLGLLDTYLHDRCLPLIPWVRYRTDHIAGQVHTLVRLPASEVRGYLRDRLTAALDRARMRAGQMPRKSQEYDPTMPPVLTQLRETMRVAMTMYRPKPYHGGPIVYLRSVKREAGVIDPMPAWQRVARGGLVVAEIPGTHYDLIAEPELRVVAAVLDQYLKA